MNYSRKFLISQKAKELAFSFDTECQRGGRVDMMKKRNAVIVVVIIAAGYLYFHPYYVLSLRHQVELREVCLTAGGFGSIMSCLKEPYRFM